MKDFKIAIIILGRPGSGKDTQAELLAKKFGLVHIISSGIIKKVLALKKKTIRLDGQIYNLEKERYLIQNGFLNTFTFVAALIKNEIRKIARQKRGLIMSASPRSLVELEEELPLIQKLYGKDNIYFFHVKISPREVYVRSLKRQRKDLPLDTRKAIKKRLEVFTHDTWPVIKYLKKQKQITDINGEQPIAPIHRDILKFLLPKIK
jgi:adenylate kinase